MSLLCLCSGLPPPPRLRLFFSLRQQKQERALQALREEHEAAVAAIKAAHTAELQQLDTKLDDVSARAMQVCLPVCLPVSVCVRRTNDCVTPGNKARLSTAIFLSPPVQTHTHTHAHYTHAMHVHVTIHHDHDHHIPCPTSPDGGRPARAADKGIGRALVAARAIARRGGSGGG